MSTEPRPRYRIRNGNTGTYVHLTLLKIAEFIQELLRCVT